MWEKVDMAYLQKPSCGDGRGEKKDERGRKRELTHNTQSPSPDYPKTGK
jgi:hypothetical protein